MNKVEHKLRFLPVGKNQKEMRLKRLLLRTVQSGGVFLVAILIIATSCRKNPDFDKLSTKPIVATKYDPKGAFGNYKKYKLPKYILKIDSSNPDDTLVDTGIANEMFTKIRENLNARGYQEVAFDAVADIAVNPLAIKNIENITYYTSGMWWGYDPWYWGSGWGYGGYYPYYPYPVSYTYTSGIFLMEMVDLKNPLPSHLTVLWHAWITGVIYDNTSTLVFTKEAIDEAFSQSPYIKTNL